jgi:hypothetical protein
MSWESASTGDQRLRTIIFHLLDSDKRLMDFLFDPEKPRLRKRAGVLKEDAWCFSHGEQILIRTALEIWCGSGHVFLWELLESLDDRNLRRVLKGIEEVRGVKNVIAAD